jgi:ribonuclease G
MGGIIVVDFIDLSNPENRKVLFEFLEKKWAMIKQTQILPQVNLD